MVNLGADIIGGGAMIALAIASNLRAVAEAILAGSAFQSVIVYVLA
jgi:hypothetical protein